MTKSTNYGLREYFPTIADLICRELGYRDYPHYQQSEHWAQMRARTLERDSTKCFRCIGKANRVHHREYSLANLGENDLSQLVSLCEGCHGFVHWDDHGGWRSDSEQEAALVSEVDMHDLPQIPAKLERRLQEPISWSRMSATQRQAWVIDVAKGMTGRSVNVSGKGYRVVRVVMLLNVPVP